MRLGFAASVIACATVASLVGCVPRAQQTPQVVRTPVHASERPFDALPNVTLVENQQTGPMYRVQIVAAITRDVMPTDDLALVINVGDHEVGRYPIVGRFEAKPTLISQDIELPLGDYEVEYDYKGVRYAGMPFRLAEVPVWGGHRALQLRKHPGTRVSLAERKLWVGRWWANDGPPQSWIIEWVHDGAVATTTSGREDRGIPGNTSRIVSGAAGAYRSERVVENTLWTFGEQYPIPDVVTSKPGPWAARIVHGNSAPIAVVFTVQPGGRLAEASTRRIGSSNWQATWSKRLEQRALSITEVERLTAKLPNISSSQPFDDTPPPASATLEPALRISTAAVRALFRSRQLAELWWQYETLNTPSAATGATNAAASRTRAMDVNAYPSAKRPATAAATSPSPALSAKDQAERRTKLRALRTQIEGLIKVHGGPWKADEFPHS